MRLTFRLRFHTRFGQNLFLTGNHAIFGEGEFTRALPMQYLDEQFWQITLVIPSGMAPDTRINYNYVLQNPDGSLLQDGGRDKAINPARCTAEETLIIDSWNSPAYFENAFYTVPFQQVLLTDRRTEVPASLTARTTHTFLVKSPLVKKGQTLCLLGDKPELANWDRSKPVLLRREGGSEYFSTQLDLENANFPIAYKYGVFDVEQREFLLYEDGHNRLLYDSVNPHKQTIINDGFALLPSDGWKGAGVAIPVFSLRSESSFGIGEFRDLKLLVDWCKKSGLKLIQILPINDTISSGTWTDSYPYAAISAFALHPIYLALDEVAEGQNRDALVRLEPERLRLNALDCVDYEAVIRAKLSFLRQIYPLQKAKTFKSRIYREFFEGNKQWLVPYAEFSCLRDKFGTPIFENWPEHSKYKDGVARALQEDSGFYYFLQYHLHIQLKAAADYAHANGVILKGDIAIGVARNGADAWQSPELYHMEFQAGAPPDAFAVKGQNWGFPTYNWTRMKESGFAWWKQRFAQMGRYFDAFRIDHILGFFRIWSIPTDAVEGILGYFVPALPVEIGEFQTRGIPFDRERFTRPYITDSILFEIFGNHHDSVRKQFLESDRFGNYSLRKEFVTQRQVERHFAGLESNELNQKLKLGLYDLISNVLLFEVTGSEARQFHFRFAIENTSSFRDLNPLLQQQLKELYIDYFFRRQDGFWMTQAMQKLPALKRVTNMLVCGEDLGLVPSCVPDVMKQLGLLSLEIQRMPKDLGRDFSRPQEAPYLSVVTPGSHDMSTIRGWWSENSEITQRFFNQELGRDGAAPRECSPELNKAIILQHLASSAMWSIFQLQDLLGMDSELRRANFDEERINIPAIPNYYWRYRMHLTLEKLLQGDRLVIELKSCLAQTGR